ncbi:MAG: glutathione S-transferase family protein [Acetobacteraceae bacterium]|nr:glutathione S-transferase family protein [Acetobacteraceae bacterium]
MSQTLRAPGVAESLDAMLSIRLEAQVNLIFYYSPNSIALAAHIVLDEIGADYTAVKVDFGQNEQQSGHFKAINPKGRVPALATECGILTETPAILTYLAQIFPESTLVPANNPFLFAKIQEFNAYLCATVHVAHAHKNRGRRWVDDEVALAAIRKKVPESMEATCRLIEDGLLQGPWVMGEHYTICDPYLFAVARWLEADGVDATLRLPRIAEHRARMLARPATARLMAECYV